VEEVVLSLWNRRQEIGPFPAKVEIFVSLWSDVCYGIPSGSVGLDIFKKACLLAVGRGWEREGASIARRNHHEPAAQLRHSEIRGVKNSVDRAIAASGSLVYLVDRLEYVAKPFIFPAVGQTLNVLQQKNSWPSLLENPQIRAKCPRAGIVKAEGITVSPVASLRKRLARRSADQDIDLTGMRSGCLQHLTCRDIKDIPLNDLPFPSTPERFASVVIHFHRQSGFEARSLEPVVQPTGP
jgi:hypothetical protein